MPTPRSSLQRQTLEIISNSQATIGTKTTPGKQIQTQQNPSSLISDVVKVAIDLGSYSIRICIAKPGVEDAVIVKYPNVVVKQSQKRIMGSTTKLLVGPQIQHNCNNYGALSIRQPMDRGLIIDWPTQKLILDVSLAEALKVAEISSVKSENRLLEGMEVIITESYFNLPDLQAGIDILFLEGYGASKIWRCNPATLILYHSILFNVESSTVALDKRRKRPECLCVVDLGHNATHVVPIINDSVVWSSVRRHIISQRLITNFLKETLSFRQWDMMDEGWLVGHIKEECCFVAPKSGSRGDTIKFKDDEISDWSYAGMLEMCTDLPIHRNPLTIEYVLPNYAVSSSRGKLGYTKGEEASKLTTSLRDYILKSANQSNGHTSMTQFDSQEDISDKSDDDFHEGSPELTQSPAKRKRKGVDKAIRAQTMEIEEEVEQVLVLERERFQVPEVMFDPGIIGLDEAPLQQVIEDSIKSCDADIQDLLWSNIVLIGGGAKMMGMKERLRNELRPKAPADVSLHLFIDEDPTLSAIKGAQALFNESNRIMNNHFISAQEYSTSMVREKFDSWSSVTLPALTT